MTRKSAVRQIILSTILILLFDYVIYIEYFDRTGGVIFAGLGFFVVPFSSLVLGIALSRLFFFDNLTHFSLFTLAKKDTYLKLKKEIGKTKIVLVNTTYLSTFMICIGLSAFFILKHADKYKSDQLDQSGVYQTVVIKAKRMTKGASVSFDINDNGSVFEGHLPTDEVGGINVGDTIKIRFSTKDHNLVDGPYY